MVNRLSLVLIAIASAIFAALLLGAQPRTDRQWEIAAQVRQAALIHGTIRFALVVVAVVVIVIVIVRLRYRREYRRTPYVVEGTRYYLEDSYDDR